MVGAPTAKDTLDGIADWWVRYQEFRCWRPKIERALPERIHVFCAPVHGLSVVCTYLVQSSEVLKNAKSEVLARSACGFAVFCSLLVLVPNYRYPKHDFVGARNFVDAARKPEDAVATIGLAAYAFSKYYAPSWQVVNSWQEIVRLRPGSRRIWLVYTSELQLAASNPEALNRIKSEFELVARFPGTLGDGAVFVYRSRPTHQKHPF